jgi:hypothetical protein
MKTLHVYGPLNKGEVEEGEFEQVVFEAFPSLKHPGESSGTLNLKDEGDRKLLNEYGTAGYEVILETNSLEQDTRPMPIGARTYNEVLNLLGSRIERRREAQA